MAIDRTRLQRTTDNGPLTTDNPQRTILQGVLHIDKPAGITSARAVGRVKRLLPRKTKIGHAGTLDPFATGVLLLLVGRATKSCESMMDLPKQYEATIKFGATTATDDPESPEISWPGELITPTIRQIEDVLPRFIGEILQQPPIFSALKVKGRRAYDLARGGQEVTLAARMVKVYGIEMQSYDWPLLRLRIDCGRGTYIRSIARDIGAALNVGGHLMHLRRTRVGQYSVESAIKLDDLDSQRVIASLKLELSTRKRDPSKDPAAAPAPLPGGRL